MWDMIERMFSDRLWIYTALAGSVFGAIFIAYMSTTRIGLWFYAKVDCCYNWAAKRYDLEVLSKEEKAMIR